MDKRIGLLARNYMDRRIGLQARNNMDRRIGLLELGTIWIEG